MDRRDFLITSGGAVVAATSSAAAHAGTAAEPAGKAPSAHPAIVLRLGIPWPDAPNGPVDGLRRLARRFELMTSGRYRIEIAAGTASERDADLYFATAHHFAGHHRAFAYFAGLPGRSGLDSVGLGQWMSVGGGQMLWDDLAGQHGWKPLLAGHTGEAPLLWSRQPIAGLESLGGQRIAVDGLGGDVARALGAEPVVLAPGDAVQALAEGSVYAAELGGAVASLASGVGRVAAHVTGAPLSKQDGSVRGLNGYGTALSLHVRVPVWNQLPEADQAILAMATADQYHADIAEALTHEQIARDTLARSFGATFAYWPVDVADAIGRVAEATIAHVAASDAVAERIDHSYFAFRNMLSGDPPGPRRMAAVG